MQEIVLSNKDFENVECLSCGSEQFEDYDTIRWKDQVLSYRICMNCGLKYMSPRPVQDWYHKYYKEGFWQELLKRNAFQDQGGSFRITEKKKILKQKLANNKRRAKRINRILEPLIPRKKGLKILEIGAGFGQTLLLFKRRYGANISAIEPNEEAREYLKSISIPLIGEYAQDLSKLPVNEKFDIIITSHVLENLSYPKKVLEIIATYLKDEGLYFIDTTNMYYRNDVNPYHMLVYTPESLISMLNRVGLNPIKLHFEDYPDTIKSYKKVKKLDPYLSAVCKKGESIEKKISVDVGAIKKNQILGAELYVKAQKKALVLHNRIDKRILNKVRRIFNLPIPVILSKEQFVNE